MKKKLETVLRTLNEAERQLVEAKESTGVVNGHDSGPLDEVEMGIDWVRRKLEKLMESEQAK